MLSWDWLWVVGELGITYGFYAFWKKNDKYAAVLEVENIRSLPHSVRVLISRLFTYLLILTLML